MIDHLRIGTVRGDRLLVRRLQREERRKGLYLPAERVRNQVKDQTVWWGVVERCGLDTRYGDAYGLKAGDVVGFTDIGARSDAFECADGELRLFVPEEFSCVRDAGRLAAQREDRAWSGEGPGLEPVGPYVLVRPDPVEDKKNGVVRPHSTQGQPLEGTLVGVSAGYLDGVNLVPHDLDVGARVLYGEYSGTWARFPDQAFVLIQTGRGERDELRAVLVPAAEREVAHA